jgi:dTDP-4-amino-4,6-dideoxygalactose transaminase
MKRYGDLEKRYLAEVIDSGELFYARGAKTKALEATIKDRFQMPYVAFGSSGTAVIHAAIGALDLPPGSEIITTPVTDMGTVIGILYQNQIPMFADIDPHTYNITAESIAKVITDRTKAIVAVHLAGNPCEMDEILAVARRNNLKVIEDCAQSYGCRYKGKYIGTMGDLGCYSLNVYKHLSAGEGGFVMTRDPKFHEWTVNYTDKFYDRLGTGHRLDRLAPNYRITELQSAVALAQFSRFDEIVTRSHDIGTKINDGLKDIPGLIPHKVYSHNYCTYWFTMITVDPEIFPASREELVAALKFEGVNTGIGYIPKPLYLEPLFLEKRFFGPKGTPWPAELAAGTTVEYKAGACPNAEYMLQNVIKIGLDYTMSDAEVDRILSGFHNAYEGLQDLDP